MNAGVSKCTSPWIAIYRWSLQLCASRAFTFLDRRISRDIYAWRRLLIPRQKSLSPVRRKYFAMIIASERASGQVGDAREHTRMQTEVQNVPIFEPKSVDTSTFTLRSFCTLPMISAALLSVRCASWLGQRCLSSLYLHEIRTWAAMTTTILCTRIRSQDDTDELYDGIAFSDHEIKMET